MDDELRKYLNAVVALLALNFGALVILLPAVASDAPFPDRAAVFGAVVVVSALVTGGALAYAATGRSGAVNAPARPSHENFFGRDEKLKTICGIKITTDPRLSRNPR